MPLSQVAQSADNDARCDCRLVFGGTDVLYRHNDRDEVEDSAGAFVRQGFDEEEVY